MQVSVRFAMAALVLVGCGGDIAAGQHGGQSGAMDDLGGSVALSVMSDRSETGTVSYTRSVLVTSGPAACETFTQGVCQVDPCFIASSTTTTLMNQTVPNVGEVSIVGAQMSDASLEPGGQGSYDPLTVQGAAPWSAGGEPVTLSWGHLPGGTGGGTVSLATPPYITLDQVSAFFTPTSTVARSDDLSVSWTNDTPPTAQDMVIVSLVTANTSGSPSGSVSGASTRILCTFQANAQAGVVPAAALAYLTAGSGTYGVHSKEYASATLRDDGGASWHLGFNVMADARTSTGLARGPVTFQ